MPSKSLIHEYAMKLARINLGIIAPALMGSERKEAFGLFYEAAMQEISQYEQRAERMRHRLMPLPSKN
jgi:hypothetical protein